MAAVVLVETDWANLPPCRTQLSPCSGQRSGGGRQTYWRSTASRGQAHGPPPRGHWLRPESDQSG
eukprot:8008982-Lingulodinium_polyedra.AAC.1